MSALAWLGGLMQSALQAWRGLRTPSVPLELQHVWDRSNGDPHCIMCNVPLTPTTRYAVCPRFSDVPQVKA